MTLLHTDKYTPDGLCIYIDHISLGFTKEHVEGDENGDRSGGHGTQQNFRREDGDFSRLFDPRNLKTA